MSIESKKDALERKVKLVHDLIAECEKLAREADWSFRLDLAYGMGGSYSKMYEDEYDYDYNIEQYPEGWRWYASSQSC